MLELASLIMICILVVAIASPFLCALKRHEDSRPHPAANYKLYKLDPEPKGRHCILFDMRTGHKVVDAYGVNGVLTGTFRGYEFRAATLEELVVQLRGFGLR